MLREPVIDVPIADGSNPFNGMYSAVCQRLDRDREFGITAKRLRHETYLRSNSSTEAVPDMGVNVLIEVLLSLLDPAGRRC